MLASTSQRCHAVGCGVDGKAFGCQCIAHEFGGGRFVVHNERDARGGCSRRISVSFVRGHARPEPAKPIAAISGPPLPLRRYECRMSARQRVHASAVWMVGTWTARNRASIADERSNATLS